MLSNLVSSSTGTRMEAMMMMPPMVGVPFFCNCPSRPRSRMVSPIWAFCNFLMTLLPIINEMKSDSTMAKAALKDMYWNIPAPGKFSSCNQSKR